MLAAVLQEYERKGISLSQVVHGHWTIDRYVYDMWGYGWYSWGQGEALRLMQCLRSLFGGIRKMMPITISRGFLTLYRSKQVIDSNVICSRTECDISLKEKAVNFSEVNEMVGNVSGSVTFLQVFFQVNHLDLDTKKGRVIRVPKQPQNRLFSCENVIRNLPKLFFY